MEGEWSTFLVGDLADSISETHNFDKKQLIFLNTSDVLHGKLLHHSYSDVSDWPGQAKKSIRKGDILFSEIRPANGRWAYVDIEADDYVVSTKLMVIRARTSRVQPRFLYHFLTSAQTTSWLQHLAESRSGTFPQITFDQVAELELMLPSLPIQEEIAGFLDAIDDKVELIRRMNETLEAIARSLFRSWFVDFVPVRAKFEGRDPGLPKGIADLFPDSFDTSELGEIPDGWEIKSVADICKSVTRGVTPSYQEGTGRFIINQRVNRGTQLDWSALKELTLTLDVPDDRYAKRWDVLVNCLGEGTLGRTHYFKGVSDIYAVDQHMSICRATTIGGGAYLYQILACPEGQERIESLKTGSTGMTMFNISKLREFQLLWPGDTLVEEYFKTVEPIWTRVARNEEETGTLTTLRDTLLPKLISGELRIANVERHTGGYP